MDETRSGESRIAAGGSDAGDPSDGQPDPADEHALDPGEHWGQGVDSSHPVSATDQPLSEIPGSGTGTADESGANDDG